MESSSDIRITDPNGSVRVLNEITNQPTNYARGRNDIASCSLENGSASRAPFSVVEGYVKVKLLLYRIAELIVNSTTVS